MVFWLTQAASWLAGKIPRWLRLALAGSLTTLVYYVWASKRRVTIANMAQILGTTPSDPRARQLAHDSWRNYGRYLSDFFYLPNSTSQEVLAQMRDVSDEPGIFKRVDAALERGKGLIIVTAHFGAFDVAGVVVAARTPLAVIADTFTDPRMDELIQSQRASFGLTVIRAEKSPRPILRALKDNQAVAIVIDRPLSPGDGTPVTFFGARCYAPSGVAQLALLSGAAVTTGFCYYDGRHSETYYGVLNEPIIPESTGNREADALALTQRLYSGLEEAIRQRPEQWYMFRPFWPFEPDGQPESAPESAPVGALSSARQAAQHD